MTPRPILLIGDCPSQASGLARITRDLATLLASMPEFRVATLGWMGTGSARLPWTQYHMQAQEFGELSLPAVWDEFSRGAIGIVMTVWDWSRLVWLARPELCEIESTRTWLVKARQEKFKLWGYVPLDATGVNGRLTVMAKHTLLGFDRLLAYTPWARDVIAGTIGVEAAEARGLAWMPHGLNMKVWKP